MTQFGFIREWIASWKLLRHNLGFVLASGLIDLVFFVLFGLATAPIFDKLTQHVIIIGSLVSQLMQAPAGRARPAVMDALFMEPARQFTWQFLGLLLLLTATIFVLYCVFQGINWWMALSVAGKNVKVRDFLVLFAKINLAWFGLFVVWYVADAIFDLRRLVIEKATGEPVMASAILMYVVLFIIVYLALYSYPTLSIRKAFSSESFKFLPAFILILLHVLAGNIIVTWLGKLGQPVMFVVGAMILFVLMAWARVYISRSVRSA